MRARPPKNKNWIFSVILFGALIAMSLMSLMNPQRINDKQFADAPEISISEVTRGYDAGRFSEITIHDNKVFIKTVTGALIQSYKESRDTVSQLGWNDSKNNTIVQVENREAANMFMAVLPDLLFFLLVIGGLIWLFRGVSRSQSNAMSFGKSKARVADAKQVKTRFKNVAGMEEPKEDLVEIVDFLKNPKKYTVIGAKIPKGVLLIGSPGTGKTLLARAVAGEAGVPFFSIAGSEFVEMFVGVGASRVRDLFAKAKRNSPCIIFIDEIDAVGRQRGGAGFGGGHDEREQTLNQILTEMDGFEQGTNVIVVAATNRPDVLDKALLRPGRFDRRIFIDKPDLLAREKILEVHTLNKKMGKNINLEAIAQKTVGLTGADLENIMNEAAILAAKRKKKTIGQQDIDDAVEKVALGPEKRSRKLSKKETAITAYHELGHAIVGYECKESDPLHKISIVSRGQSLGVTWFLPKEDQFTTSKTKFLDEICGLLGGRAAEELIYKEMTTGASNDIERASAIARNMAMRYGMGEGDLGPVAYGEKQGGYLGTDGAMTRNFSEEKAKQIDSFVKKTVEAQYARALTILKKNKTKLEKLTTVLLKTETMTVEEFMVIYTGKKAKTVKKKA
jgi:cell division protease FtsH